MLRSRWPAVLIAVLLVGATAPPASFGESPGWIIGRVTDARGDPIAGANLLLLGTAWGATSDADGSYHIPRIPAGEWSVRAAVIGFETEVRTAELKDGAATRIDFQLQRQCGRRRPAVDLTLVEMIREATRVEVFRLAGLQRADAGPLPDEWTRIAGVPIESQGPDAALHQVRMLQGLIEVARADTCCNHFDCLSFLEYGFRIHTSRGPLDLAIGDGCTTWRFDMPGEQLDYCPWPLSFSDDIQAWIDSFDWD